MGREVRMVPPDWEHPTDGTRYRDGSPRYIPMFNKSHSEAMREYLEKDLPEWEEGERLWGEGKVKLYSGKIISVEEQLANSRRDHAYRVPENPDYTWWAGERPSPPDPKHYMPDWPAEARTHYMMYEDTSEGTPISPAFATPEELARWLADTGASAFGGETASYEAWLSTIRRGHAFSALLDGGKIISGVEANYDAEQRQN